MLEGSGVAALHGVLDAEEGALGGAKVGCAIDHCLVTVQVLVQLLPVELGQEVCLEAGNAGAASEKLNGSNLSRSEVGGVEHLLNRRKDGIKEVLAGLLELSPRHCGGKVVIGSEALNVDARLLVRAEHLLHFLRLLAETGNNPLVHQLVVEDLLSQLLASTRKDQVHHTSVEVASAKALIPCSGHRMEVKERAVLLQILRSLELDKSCRCVALTNVVEDCRHVHVISKVTDKSVVDRSCETLVDQGQNIEISDLSGIDERLALVVRLERRHDEDHVLDRAALGNLVGVLRDMLQLHGNELLRSEGSLAVQNDSIGTLVVHKLVLAMPRGGLHEGVTKLASKQLHRCSEHASRLLLHQGLARAADEALVVHREAHHVVRLPSRLLVKNDVERLSFHEHDLHALRPQVYCNEGAAGDAREQAEGQDGHCCRPRQARRLHPYHSFSLC
mmetsp:Transcript_6857/g.28909  ORF Transcript_6857/g.28909 Transcript_6857/m.28909 type:complete len:446 (-) Transcript_6857:5-1342(-)